MDTKKKPSFIDRVKEALTPGKGKPGFHEYNTQELQCLLIKSRVSLENRISHLNNELDTEILRLNGYREIMENDEYLILTDIAEKIVELKAMKLATSLLRRLQEKAGAILQSKASLDQIQEEVLWIQNLLWVRKVKRWQQLDELNEFARNFFRGVDIVEDSTLQSRLYTDIRLTGLKPTEIPFDLIHNEFQAALSRATYYPMDRKARMFDLNRSNMDVLKVLMDQQRITGDTPYSPTINSNLRNYGNNTAVSQIRENGNQSLNKSSDSLMRNDGRVNQQTPGFHEQFRPSIDAHLNKDEVFSLSAIRKYYNGQPTLFPESLRVQPFKP